MQMFREYEFQFNGFNFISSVDIMSPIYKQINALPDGVFVQMNLQALTSLLANTPMTIPAIRERLKEMNAGGSYAFISLGDNN